MIKEILKEYEEKFSINYENNFTGRLMALEKTLKNPNLMLSDKLLKELNLLIKNVQKPLQIGVIGQFSSGKSSLLNLLLNKPVLATGARPVSVVATYINYSQDELVLKNYENGTCKIAKDKVNDQNEEENGLKSIDIFTNNPCLKDITLIDTPGLNANKNDEEFSKNLIKSFDALIWLSLAESAGKASEENIIKTLNKDIKKICLVNQKDKLSKQEQEKLQIYLNQVFDKYFEKIELISCKMARDGDDDSNIKAFFDFLNKLDKKSIKIKNTLNALNTLKIELLELISSIYNSLDLLDKNISNYVLLVEKNEFDYDTFNQNILNTLKNMAKIIADEFMLNFKNKNACFYTKNQSLLHKNCFIEKKYDYKTISPDDAFLNIFYNKDSINKHFLKIKKDINAKCSKVLDDLNEKLNEFKNNLNILKTKEIDKNHSELVLLDFYAISDDFYKALDELIINDYERALNNHSTELIELFMMINIKALNNFENATKLSLSFFYEKINASREFYELDSDQFKIYLPRENEILERLLTDCNFYEFEEILINKKQMQRLRQKYLDNLKNILKTQQISIKNRQKTLENIKISLLNSFKELEAIDAEKEL